MGVSRIGVVLSVLFFVIRQITCLDIDSLKDVVVEKAIREVDLTQRYATVLTKLNVINKGKHVINHFYHAVTMEDQINTVIVLLRLSDSREVLGEYVNDLSIRQIHNSTLIRFNLETPL